MNLLTRLKLIIVHNLAVKWRNTMFGCLILTNNITLHSDQKKKKIHMKLLCFFAVIFMATKYAFL